MQATALTTASWREPVDVLAALGDQPWTAGFLSAGDGWSYICAEPDAVLTIFPDDPRDAFATLRSLAGPRAPAPPGGPPFAGGVAGLLGYELASRIEALGLPRSPGWPDLACARYPAVLAFDHRRRRVVATGRGRSRAEAEGRARKALSWLKREATPRPLACSLEADDPQAYEAAVAEVVERIAGGEIFQANVARRWTGRAGPDDRPAELLRALAAAGPAPFASYLRLPDAAVVSNSPERFVRATAGGEVRTEPIKGTAPRGASPCEDRANVQRLLGSAKDRAENLMIVDLMRNDLARVCAPGSVRVPELFRPAALPNVHHLVSTVTGRLTAGHTPVDLLQAAFPAGSITGAPKVQAMKVIAGLEPPRGPFFGSMFLLGFDGYLDSSVLIRTAAFRRDELGWAVEARAGAGIVADSQPVQERLETEAKISVLAKAMSRQPRKRPA